MTTIKQYNSGSGQWETIVVGKQGPGVAVGGNSGQFLKKNSATNYDTTWASVPPAGLVFIKSQAIAVGGTTAVVSGVFSATYRNYLVVIDRAMNSSPNNASLYMTIGSVNTGYYFGGRSQSFSGANFSHSGSNGPYFFVGYTEQQPWGGQQITSITVSAPYLTTRTTFTALSFGGEYASFLGGTLLDENAQTDFTITISAGTFQSGQISVYGYPIA